MTSNSRQPLTAALSRLLATVERIAEAEQRMAARLAEDRAMRAGLLGSAAVRNAQYTREES
jgi:hypothetical protein